MSAVAERRYTPEDLLAMPDSNLLELVNGELVEKDMGAVSSWVEGQILHLLKLSGQEPGLGWALPGTTSYQCFADDRRKVRKPDVSFIRRGRLAGEQLPEGHIPIPPDLAVEVISPNDTAYKVDAKVAEYLGAGVPLVWMVYPETRTVQVLRPDGTAERLGGDDELTAPEILPGFRCRVADLFTSPVRP